MNDHNTHDASGQRRDVRTLTSGTGNSRKATLLSSQPGVCFVTSPRHLAARCVTTHSAVPSAAFFAWRDSNRLASPNLCTRCCDAAPHGGAEVDIAVLFADVRGSTALGERTPAADFATLTVRRPVVFFWHLASPDRHKESTRVHCLPQRCAMRSGGRRTGRAGQSRIIPNEPQTAGVTFADSQSLTASWPIW